MGIAAHLVPPCECESHGRTGCGRPERQVGQSASQPRHRDPSPSDIAKKSPLIVWGAAGCSGVERLAAFLSADPVITAADRFSRSILYFVARSTSDEKKKKIICKFIILWPPPPYDDGPKRAREQWKSRESLVIIFTDDDNLL